MTANEICQLLFIGGGAIIGFIVAAKVLYFLLRYLIKALLKVGFLIIREVPQLVVQALATILGSFLTTHVARTLGIPVEDIVSYFANWITQHGDTSLTFITQFAAQLSAAGAS